MKKLIYIILFLLMSIVLIFSIYSSLNLSFFGFRIYKIGSGSMSPNLEVGDIIIVKKATNYKKGDIVTYYFDNSTVTHRIVKINKTEIITRGDANNIDDKPIGKKEIIGKLFIRIKYTGFINYLLTRPFFWIIMFACGLFITILIPDKK